MNLRVVHVHFRHGNDCWERKDNRHKERPYDTHCVHSPAKKTASHVKWTRFEVYLRVISEQALSFIKF